MPRIQQLLMDLFSALSPFVFCSLASGSNGNCYYVGNGDEGILIDAGIGLRSIRKRLKEIGVALKQVKAVFITHDHIDHIRGLSALVNSMNLPVYATKETWEGISNNRATSDISPEKHCPITEEKTLLLIGFQITPFSVSHDASGAVGFHVLNSHHSLCLATDLGHIGERAGHYLKKASMLVLESNYDEEMLTNGRYPVYLQNRIRGDKGHLGNNQTADFLAENYHPGMKHILLCHLSEHNNTANLVLSTLRNRLTEQNVNLHPDTSIRTLPRMARTELIHIGGL